MEASAIDRMIQHYCLDVGQLLRFADALSGRLRLCDWLGARLWHSFGRSLGQRPKSPSPECCRLCGRSQSEWPG
jgi:hypothetical protein